MAEMRQLVVNLQGRERATDSALAKSRLVSEKISGMKEYQEEVANMNECWRMQGRKMLLAGLQQENRQILQLQQENRELRQTLEDYEGALRIVMQKHRIMVSSLKHQPASSVQLPQTMFCRNEMSESSRCENIISLSRLLNECFINGERVANSDQELIARLTKENACLRELLNISCHNEKDVTCEFLARTAQEPSVNCSNGATRPNCDNDDEALRDGASTPTSISQNDWAENSIKRNTVVASKKRKALDDNTDMWVSAESK